MCVCVCVLCVYLIIIFLIIALIKMAEAVQCLKKVNHSSGG